MSISKKIRTYMESGSWIRKMFEQGIALKQEHGEENVFDLSLGNPIMEPPQEFFNELRHIALDPLPGLHRYMPNAGYAETRTAVAEQLLQETGLNFTANEIIMTCGAGGALNVVLKTTLDPGDEVMIFAPYFVEYQFYADNHGGVCRIVPPDESFYPNMEIFENSFNDHTKVVLINSPNNPTGIVYKKNLLSRMAQIIQGKEKQYGTEIYLVSDEPYRKILFDGVEYPHVFHHHPRSIVATSHSKDLALPGERIGFIAVNPQYEDRVQLMDGLTFCNRTLGFVNAPAIMQHIVKNLQTVTIDSSQYQTKRDFMYNHLTEMGYSVIKPQGAFYMFPRSPIENDEAFVADLQTQKVLVVPGRGFGMPGHFRISYCVDDRTLEGSLPGFKTAIQRHQDD